MDLLRRVSLTLALLLMACCAASAQSGYATVTGTVTDVSGKPVAGATVHFKDRDNGRVFDYTTNENGVYRGVGITRGTFDVTLLINGQTAWQRSGYQVFLWNRGAGSGETSLDLPGNGRGINNLDFNLLELEKSAGGHLRNQAEVDARHQEVIKAEAENALKAKFPPLIEQANAELAFNRFDKALAIVRKIPEMGPQFAASWAILGDTCLQAGLKAEKAQERQKSLREGVDAYEKAIELEQRDTATESERLQAPNYYRHLGESLALLARLQSGASLKMDAEFELAFKLIANDLPKNAIPHLDKAIATSPALADPYFYRAAAELGTGDTDTPPPLRGAVEDLQRYLQYQPSGVLSQLARDTLSFLKPLSSTPSVH